MTKYYVTGAYFYKIICIEIREDCVKSIVKILLLV